MRAYHLPCVFLLVASSVVTSASARAPLQVEVYRPAGTPTELRVRGRVTRDRATRFLPTGEGVRARALRSNAGALLTHEIAGASVRVQVAGQTLEATTDKDGFFEVAFSFDPPQPVGEQAILARARVAPSDDAFEAEGWETAILRPPAGELLLITDIDDTLIETHVTQKARFLESVFLRDAATVKVVPGMAGLLRCLVLGRSARGVRGTSLHYASASPVNFYRKLAAVLARHRFPLGAIHLRHLQMKGLAGSSAYKVATIERIAARFPGYPILLLGDGGERDPEVYREVREKLGGRVVSILIRRVPGEASDAGRFDGLERFSTGVDAAQVLERLGLLHPACAEYLPRSVADPAPAAAAAEFPERAAPSTAPSTAPGPDPEPAPALPGPAPDADGARAP